MRLGGINYIGDTKGNDPATFVAHGVGKIEYDDGRATKGQFIDGKIQ